MDDIKDRFKLIMEREKLTAGAFAESVGASQAAISHILSGRNKPGVDLVLRIHQRYADINLEWLLTGKGNMSNDLNFGSTDSLNADSCYPLFAENAKNPDASTNCAENRKETLLESTAKREKSTVNQEIIYKERPPRKITEIRIFFDDNTYETFKPAN